MIFPQSSSRPVLSLPRSKSDQRGRGAVVSVVARAGSPWCPVEALERWIAASGRDSGAVFVGAGRGPLLPGAAVTRLSTRTVARVVRAAATAAGLATGAVNEFSSHSLRRGQITTALEGGAALDDVMRHARHGSPRSILLYREVADAVRRQPRAAIGPPDGVMSDGTMPEASERTDSRMPAESVRDE